MKENTEEGDASVKYHYVELKTAKSLDNFREEGKFRRYNMTRPIKYTSSPNILARYKMMNFWIQSFLGDVPEIKVGFRDDHGIVSKIESFQTLEVPKYAEQWVSISTKFLYSKTTDLCHVKIILTISLLGRAKMCEFCLSVAVTTQIIDAK